MEKLKRFRIENRLTHMEVCKYTAIQPAMLSRYENGHSVPSFTVMCKLADLYGVSLDELRDDKITES